MNRYQNLHQIQQLDPEKENCQICRIMAGYEFPWDVTRSLELALFKTFCVPRISKLLDKTGEFRYHTQKRYDDTGITIAEILKWGYDSDRGKEAIHRMNQIHGRFQITNEDFLYVLSTFIYDPIRWIERFGWRPLCDRERLAIFYFWREVGTQMQIENIPESYEVFDKYNINYEQQYFQYSPTNRRVGEATLKMFIGWFPQFLEPAIAPMVYALLDERMLEAFGFPEPPQFLRDRVTNLLKLRGRILRWLPPRTKPWFFTDDRHRSYPNGYEMSDLGPPSLLESLNRSDRSR